MPQIKLNKRVIEKVKRKEGIYSSLSRTAKITETNLPELKNSLKDLVTELVKEAFIEYARKRGCKPTMERLEWTLFNKSLQKKL